MKDDLISDIMRARSGSRELDVRIALATSHPFGFDTSEDESSCPRYSQCVNASIELFQSVLPSYRWNMGNDRGCWVGAFPVHGFTGMPVVGVSTKLSLAMVIAILLALDEKRTAPL